MPSIFPLPRLVKMPNKIPTITKCSKGQTNRPTPSDLTRILVPLDLAALNLTLFAHQIRSLNVDDTMQPRAFGKKTSTSTTTPDVDERPTHRNDRKHIYNNKPLHNSTTKNRNNIDTMHQIQKNVDTKCRTAMSPQTHTHAKPQKND
jgi:hypothetical protein